MFGIIFLFWCFIIINLLMLIVCMFIKKIGLNIYFILLNFSILLLINFVFFPYDTINRNTILKLNSNAKIVRVLSGSAEYDAYVYRDNNKYPLYDENREREVEGLLKIGDSWIISLETFYNEKKGKYIVVNESKIEYDISEEEIKKKFDLKNFKLKSARKYVDKYGENKEILYSYSHFSTEISQEDFEKKYQREKFLYSSPSVLILIVQFVYLIKKIKKAK